MNKERKLIIAGNWKMNKTVAEALDLLRRELLRRAAAASDAYTGLTHTPRSVARLAACWVLGELDQPEIVHRFGVEQPVLDNR